MRTKEEFDQLFNTYGSVTAVAEACKVSRQAIYDWMEKINYKRPKKTKIRPVRTQSSRSMLYKSSSATPTKINFMDVKRYVDTLDRDDPRVDSWLKSVESKKRARPITDTIDFINEMNGY